ncbi:hypothetical protein TRIUR3_19261 [Triticum urartu]|uniref:Rx N-terminal domain-containing protein n=2 Tax=Triticum urartu TaxID=4572 RepID=M7Z221_TRIUA|nr:hypothetical protein TRIUR3_19261 [Triticum urartu]
MVVEGVAWGVSVAGWIMSPIISKLLNKALSYCKFDKEETLQCLLMDVLPRLALTLEAVEDIHHRKFFEEMVRGLKSAFHDMEYILDDLEYIRHQKKLDKLKSLQHKRGKKRARTASDAEASTSNKVLSCFPQLLAI